MTKFVFTFLVSSICFFTGEIQAQVKHRARKIYQHKTHVYMELGGPGWYYSIGGKQKISENENSSTYVQLGYSRETKTSYNTQTIPFSISKYISSNQKSAHLELGAGLAYQLIMNTPGVNEQNKPENVWILSGRLGYQFQNEINPLGVGITFLPMIMSDGNSAIFFPWASFNFSYSLN